MERVLEKELMDEVAQAEAYAASDFSQPHNAFVAYFKETFPVFSGGVVADLGCGAADVSIRFAKSYPHTFIIGLDGSEAMLTLGRQAVEDAGLSKRVKLLNRRLPKHGLDSRYFDLVINNSLLHHLPDGQILWKSAIDLAKPGKPIFVVDLTRPVTVSAAEQLVAKYAQGAPELMARDFYNSLLAAFEPGEVQSQLAALGLDRFTVEVISDRHMMIHGRA